MLVAKTLANVKAAEGAAAPARDHEEGLRLPARRGCPDPLPRRHEVRPGGRLRAEGRREARVHERLRRLALRHGRRGSAPRRDHAGDARGLGARPLLAGVSGALLRRRHRGAARGDVRRRARMRGHEARRRHLFDVPAARLRPADPRRGAAEPSGRVRARPRRSRRRRRRDAQRSLRPFVPALPAEHDGDGPRRRERMPADAHHGVQARHAVGGPLSARRRPRRRRSPPP